MEAFPTLPEWITLEHQVATILTTQEHHGWYFDEQSARELESTLRTELESTQAKIRADFPYVAGAVFTPKRDNQRTGYVKGVSFTRLKDFNPQSRDHIAWILSTHCGWKPSSLTNSGKAVIDETVLKDIGTDIALRFLRVLELTKMLGMISEGVNAWQKLVTTSSRIHHHCSVGCATHRASHRNPNLSQVPSDERFRRLFTASPNMVMVGADLSGIELRMLAHYLARYDKGRYADILLNGDIHQENADKIGISRRQVKTVTYAFLYGAGDQKIGTSFDGSLGETQSKRKGKEIRKAFVDAIPGLSDLLQAVKRAAERGYVRGLDGRNISVDKGHVALNYLLQGSAAIIAKRWMVLADAQLDSHSHQLGFIHDELQYETIPASVNDLKFLLELTAVQAGEYYNMRCPVAAESKSGYTWADTH